MTEQNSPVNQQLERSVRLLIGDLHMRIMMLEAVIENLQQQMPQQPQAQPVVKPNGSHASVSS